MDMLPSLSIDHLRDGAFTDRKHHRDVSLLNAFEFKGSHLNNFFICKFVKTMSLSHVWIHSTLVPAISIIIQIGTNKKMLPTTTESIITSMAHQPTSRYRPALDRPRQTIRTIQNTRVAELAVTINGSSSNPRPALPKMWHVFRDWPILVNLRPEVFFKRHKQKTTPPAESIAGEVRAAVCKRSGNCVSLHGGRNKAAFSIVKERSVAS